jgi:hypothetical protein
MTTLNKREWKKLLKKIEEGLKKPSYPIPTPKLEYAMKLILKKIAERNCEK